MNVKDEDGYLTKYCELLELGPLYNQGDQDYTIDWFRSIEVHERDRILDNLKSILIKAPDLIKLNPPFSGSPKSFYFWGLLRNGVAFSDDELLYLLHKSYESNDYEFSSTIVRELSTKNNAVVKSWDFFIEMLRYCISSHNCSYSKIGLGINIVRVLLLCDMSWCKDAFNYSFLLDEAVAGCDLKRYAFAPASLAVVELLMDSSDDCIDHYRGEVVEYLRQSSVGEMKHNIYTIALSKLDYAEFLHVNVANFLRQLTGVE